jgi:hypothetical protein
MQSLASLALLSLVGQRVDHLEDGFLIVWWQLFEFLQPAPKAERAWFWLCRDIGILTQ